MRIVVVGASGTVGQTVVEALSDRHQIVPVGAHSGDFQIDMADPAGIRSTLAAIGGFDALAIAAGSVAFAGLGSSRRAGLPQVDRGCPDRTGLPRRVEG